LFDQSKKQPIPKYANKIGVVTSETGAVIRDIYHVTRNKNPYTNILVYPSKVQGEGAEKEIVDGIEYFNKEKNVDVIIVARGGGSFEDLSPFNTESVALAVFNSELPVISAVGHETDFTIIDFASDMRAPTPSVAAEIAVFDFYQELEYLENLRDSLKQKVLNVVENQKNDIENKIQFIIKAINLKLQLANKDRESLSNLILKAILKNVESKRFKLENLVVKLEKSNPLSILKSGYYKVTHNDKSLNIKEIKVGDDFDVYTYDGQIKGKVIEIKENKNEIRRGC